MHLLKVVKCILLTFIRHVAEAQSSGYIVFKILGVALQTVVQHVNRVLSPVGHFFCEPPRSCGPWYTYMIQLFDNTRIVFLIDTANPVEVKQHM